MPTTTPSPVPSTAESYPIERLRSMVEAHLSGYFGLEAKNAGMEHFYRAITKTVRDILQEKNRLFRQTADAGRKQVYYMCIEFLLGRSLRNDIYNLGLQDEIKELLASYNIDITQLYEQEADPGLGSGGLGRLAACFMDSLATLGYPAMGYSLRYEFGLFKQKLVDGWQMELPDEWLTSGEVWLNPRVDCAVTVQFDGYIEEEWKDGKLVVHHRDCTVVEAVPYDMMISGYLSPSVAVLRLWRAKNPNTVDPANFTQGNYMMAIEQTVKIESLTRVLYPSDDNFDGKSLRLRQQYFLCSASLQNIIIRHLAANPSLGNLPDCAAIHINDTHPALCVPELMRLLIDECGYSWERSWDIVTRTITYTNHTVMAEALETWPESMMGTVQPRIYSIIKEINRRLCEDLWKRHTGDWDKITRMSVIAYNSVRMANLSIVAGHSTNGVAKLHTEILKADVFKDFYQEWPERFTNVTNGIAHRRWLVQANAPLSALLDECIGPDYRTNPALLSGMGKFRNDAGVLSRLDGIKVADKQELSRYMRAYSGQILDPAHMFDVQVKRLHEYKRQLLNVLRIIAIYEQLRANPNADVVPRTFIFAAKAAPSYVMAKQIIKLIYFLGEDIRANKAVRDKLNVVFIENYSVTLAEEIMAAAEISEQISLAGKEASGTGNMKAMINGAVTIGTLDGANIEILEQVGADNMYIFGMTSKQVETLWAQRYNPYDFFAKSDTLKTVVDSLNRGYAGHSFNSIAQYLLTGGVADPFMCLADFDDYCRVHDRMDADYRDRAKWERMALNNIAGAGIFAADRAVREYAERIWKV